MSVASPEYDLTDAAEPPPNTRSTPEERAEELAHLVADTPLRQQRGDGWQWVMPCPLHDPDGTGRKPDLVIQPGETRPEPYVFCRVCGEEAWPDVRAALLAGGVPDGLLGPAGKPTGPAATRPLRAVKPTPAVEPIDERTVQDWYDRLNVSQEDNPPAFERVQERLAYLHGARGLTDDTLRAAQIGWDGERLTLPVADERGRFVNVRRYSTRAEQKMLNLPGRGSPPRWYGADALAKHVGEVLVCEGEWDRLITQQHLDTADYTHMLAVSGTHGASTLPADLEPLRGRRVHIVYDCDDAGRKGARKLAAALHEVAAAVYVVDLGLNDGEDLTDWFVKHGRSADALLDRLQAAEPAAIEQRSGRLFTRVSAVELADDPPPFEWLAKGLWPAGSYGVLAGERKTLKSYTSLALAVAVAAGVDAFGTFVVKEPGPVHIYVGEGGREPFQRRLRRIAEAYGLARTDLRELPLTVSFDTAPIMDPRFQESLARDLDELQPALVIIDPLYAFHVFQRSLPARRATDSGVRAGDCGRGFADHQRPLQQDRQRRWYRAHIAVGCAGVGGLVGAPVAPRGPKRLRGQVPARVGGGVAAVGRAGLQLRPLPRQLRRRGGRARRNDHVGGAACVRSPVSKGR